MPVQAGRAEPCRPHAGPLGSFGLVARWPGVGVGSAVTVNETDKQPFDPDSDVKLASGPGRRSVTSFDVSRAAGVSRATVSRCFTEGGLVRQSTRDHVLSVAETLSYRPNLLARMLNKQESNIVAVVTADFHNPFQPALMEALTESLRAQELVPLLLKSGSVDESADGLVELALSYRVSAIIVTVLAASHAVIRRCVDSDVPIIFLNRVVEGTAAVCVCSDVEGGAAQAADVLVQGGASRIGIITGKTGTWAHSIRRSGFVARLRALGFDPAMTEPGDFGYDSGARAATALLAANPDLEAIYACNDAMALGALDAIRLTSSRLVPGDIAVIGFDDVPISAWAAYRLSTIHQPVNALIGHVRAILDRPDRGLALAGQSVIFPCRFIERATTRPVDLRA